MMDQYGAFKGFPRMSETKRTDPPFSRTMEAGLPRRRFIAGLAGGALAALAQNPLLAATAGNMKWRLWKIGDRDYVCADDIHKFYHFERLMREDKHVWFRSPALVMRATVGSVELMINNIKFILSYPVQFEDNQVLLSRIDLCKLIDPVLRPSYIDSKQFHTVILDPGHGGHDSGATSATGAEKNFALNLGLTLRDELKGQGFHVKMTRETDVFLTLGERVRIANGIPDSIFISLHFNAGGAEASGIETYALSPQGSSSVYGARQNDYYSVEGNKRDSENIALATAVHASVMHSIAAVDRGIKRARWAVLTGIERPAILFEGGFVTNPNEVALINSVDHRKKLSTAIAKAVVNFRNALRGGKR
jgi:N-acetylmuramoyl-L-alanine amidase